MERALRAEHSFWSDFFWMEPAFSPGRNESGEEWMKEEEREGVKERKRWREKGREGYRYTVVRSVSGKMPAGIHTKKEVTQEEGQLLGRVGHGSRKSRSLHSHTHDGHVYYTKLNASVGESCTLPPPTPLPGTLSLLNSLLYGNPFRCILIHTYTYIHVHSLVRF